MRIMTLLCFVFFISGCQTTEQFKENMMSWKGKSIDAMIDNWGYPNGELTSPDGNRVYVYSKSGSLVIPQKTTYNTNAYAVGNSLHATTNAYTTGGYNVDLTCTVFVEFDSGKIIKNITWRGNNCVS
jgi:outer membrane lipoprotein-sorting protein